MHNLASRIEIPKVHLIDSFRQIREPSFPRGEPENGYAGIGLIDQVALLQNPEALQQLEHERKYALLNKFVAEVFEETTARLEVPASRGTINVRMRGSLLPLDNQGTGMHQVIIIAAAATMIEDSLVCIEEPEINLHPILQKRLLNFLMENTSNQYLITTHSAQMLDYERANVFHLEHSPSGTAVSAATTPAQVSAICVDLGYRPSDLLQSNAVIWVEGPSDRIYIRDWIGRMDRRLVEGIHYSIMFYGGSLLRDLSVDDDRLSEFINLRRLNRHLIVVMDSDRRSRGAKLTPAKLRILDCFNESQEPGFAWLTDGYTIENYVPLDVLTKAVSVVHPRSSYSWSGDRWSNPLGSLTSPNKVKIAEKVVSIWSDPTSDRRLLKWTERVVTLIRQANGMPDVRVT
ncbi:ATP-dependent nuclease [Micromonospora sp. Mcm103]|uniref:ATP-dependent nuclease n=1 Tax=Micromonospora sp. Mcm103 TaxID=2926015 RepID=UPI0021CA2690|nr:AAA family ATPase [Micromonospora sp. Mcm103]